MNRNPMKLLSTFWKKGPEEGYGRATFIASVIFALSATVFMAWREKYERDRRQLGVKEYIRKMKREQNMANYEKQKQRLNEK